MNLELFFLLSSLFLTVSGFVCEDDLHQDCERRAGAGECQGVGAQWMLSVCRKSCRNHYRDISYPPIVRTYGGLEDHVVDEFGFKKPICSENGGFTMDGRLVLLNLVALNKEQPPWVPKFTTVGFDKLKIPTELYSHILTEYNRLKKATKPKEECAVAVINCQEIVSDVKNQKSRLEDHRKTAMMYLSHQTLERLRAELQPLAEAWSGVKLKHSATYGIRRYTNGSWLTSHVDRFNTHVISAILNIGQEVTKEWPLFILDNDEYEHEVMLEPGEMVWYESARLVHGRPQPLEGKYFDNLFIHFSPSGDWYSEPFTIGRRPRPQPISVESLRMMQ